MISKMMRRGALAAVATAVTICGFSSTAEARNGYRGYGYGAPRAYYGNTVRSYRPAVVVTPSYGYRPTYSYGNAYRPNYSYGYGYNYGYPTYRSSTIPWGGYGVGGFPAGPSFGGGGFPVGPSYGGGGFNLYIGR